MEEIIRMMGEYGETKVKNAFGLVANRSEDNPKRSMAHVKRILKMEVKDEGL